MSASAECPLPVWARCMCAAWTPQRDLCPCWTLMFGGGCSLPEYEQVEMISQAERKGLGRRGK